MVLMNCLNESLPLEVDMNDSSFTEYERDQKYDDIFHLRPHSELSSWTTPIFLTSANWAQSC
jgi:hypothetical protein